MLKPLVLLTYAASIAALTAQPTLTVDVAHPSGKVSPRLYGLMTEEINHCYDGGLYAELVQNRDLEAINLPEGWRQEGKDIYTARGRHYNQWWETLTPGS